MMLRSKFDEQLNVLNNDLIEMGSLCEKAIGLSIKALTERNKKNAEDARAVSGEIDEKEREIENMCLKLLLQQQPVARDLRVISSALKMVTDMERIGDQAEDIAEIVMTANIYANEEAHTIREMAEAAAKMVTDSIDAFVNKDIELAKKVIAYDDVVDDCFDKTKSILIEYFSKPETDGEYALDLLMIAKYFERIGDHAVNIAEWVIFSITGTKEG